VAVGELGLVPEELLLAADAVDRLLQATRKQIREPPHQIIHRPVEQLEVDLQLLDLGTGGLGVGAGLHLAVHHLAAVDVAIGNDRRVAQPAITLAKHRHHFGDQAFELHLVGRPHLAGDAVVHGVFHRQKPRQEVGRTAVRGRAVLGSRLAEDRHIRGDREVAGHADLLAARDPHAVDPADGRLLAVEDSVDHGVEEIHVLAVLVRPPGVVLGVLLGVAAGAEGAVAGTREDDRHHATVKRGVGEGGDHTLHHLGGVGVELARVVEGDPRRVEAINSLPVRTTQGLLLVHRARRVVVSSPELLSAHTMVFQLVVSWQPIKTHDHPPVPASPEKAFSCQPSAISPDLELKTLNS
jgi:hypothetical protein